MDKRVTLKLNDGSLGTGFSVNLQVGYENEIPITEVIGHLPAAPDLRSHYQQWQVAYRQLSGPGPFRLGKSSTGFATNVSYVEDCYDLAEKLQRAFNQWLRAESFRPVQDKLLEQLSPNDTIRLIVQTQQDIVQRLPWHRWDICDRYPHLEIALSAPIYEKRTPAVTKTRNQVRILAVLGDSQGLDIETDLALLNHLPNTDIHCLTEPDRQTLDTHLWDTQGWDILFFAGHSSSQADWKQVSSSPANKNNSTGLLHISSTDVITIPQLKNALQTALARGLKVAIFNSCDGLGLAQSLADLQIPQILVMQEVVSDRVAHTFLKAFLEAFSRGETLYLAMREAREKLQGLEDIFPCASWLPTIYQNPAHSPPLWHEFIQLSPQVPPLPPPPPPVPRPGLMLLTHAVFTIAIIGLRYMGLFQGLELKAFDSFIKMRSKELPDPRLVVVKITEKDVQAQKDEQPRGSLSDQALLDSLKHLETMEPRVIGLDIYRDFPVLSSFPELAEQLTAHNELVTICKSRDAQANSDGIAPPPEVPEDRIGFSDFIADADGVLRRQLLALTPDPASSCLATHSLSAKLAFSYLSAEKVTIQASPEGYLQLGNLIFTPIETNEGGYRGIEAWGHQLLLNYRRLDSPDQIAQHVTLTDLREGKVSPALIRDRIVLIGTTDKSFGDYWLTPYSQSPRVEHQTSGVFLQAQMISHLLSAVLDNRPLLKTWPEWGETLWIVLWGCLGSLIIILTMFSLGKTYRHGITYWVFTLLGTELGLLGICGLLLVKSHYWVPWVPPAILLLTIASSIPITEHLRLSQTNTMTKEVP